MSSVVSGGAALAWRLLASLEGGSLLLATSALLACAAAARARQPARTLHKKVKTVLVTNVTSTLGSEIKRRLELRGCTVSTADDTSGAGSAEVDALVVVGASGKGDGLDALSALITEDLYKNLKLLESLSRRVRRKGCVAWAGAAAAGHEFHGAVAAFDAVMKAALQHTAEEVQCKAVWVGRDDAAAQTTTACRVVAALLAPPAPHDDAC